MNALSFLNLFKRSNAISASSAYSPLSLAGNGPFFYWASLWATLSFTFTSFNNWFLAFRSCLSSILLKLPMLYLFFLIMLLSFWSVFCLGWIWGYSKSELLYFPLPRRLFFIWRDSSSTWRADWMIFFTSVSSGWCAPDDSEYGFWKFNKSFSKASWSYFLRLGWFKSFFALKLKILENENKIMFRIFEKNLRNCKLTFPSYQSGPWRNYRFPMSISAAWSINQGQIWIISLNLSPLLALYYRLSCIQFGLKLTLRILFTLYK